MKSLNTQLRAEQFG